MFKVLSVSKYSGDDVACRVSIDAKAWAKIKKQGQLGALYGVDISNVIFREYGVKAHNPTVRDTQRAKRGVKYLTLTYQDADWCNDCHAAKTCDACKPGDALPELDNVIKVDFKTRRRVA